MKVWLHAGFFDRRYAAEHNHYAYALAHHLNRTADPLGQGDPGHPPPIYGVLENSLPWSLFEAEPGVYALDPMGRALDWCAAYGLKFAIKFSDKGWWFPPYDAARYRSPLPPDLSFATPPALAEGQDLIQTDSAYLIQRPAYRVTVAKRWSPRVAARFEAFLAAVCQTYRAHPAWEALLTPETSLAVSSAAHLAAVGYPGAAWYADAVMERAAVFQALARQVQLFVALNWLPLSPDGRLHEQVAARLAALGVGLEAVDLWPGSPYETLVYPQWARLPAALRWTNLTGETVRSGLPARAVADTLAPFEVGNLGIQQLEGDYDWFALLGRRSPI